MNASEQTKTSGRGPEQFNKFYGTVRDSKFDGLHWLGELGQSRRREVEDVCADVLKHYDYPLVYPQEKMLDETPRLTSS